MTRINIQFVAASTAIVLFFAPFGSLCAQNSPVVDIGLEFSLATAYLASDKLDSSIIHSEKLMNKLKDLGQEDSLLGLKTQLLFGTALYANGDDTKALLILEHTQLISKKIENWEIYAEATCALALHYEKAKDFDQSMFQLRLAQAAIAQHKLNSIYPRFAIRISSCKRMLGQKDSAIYYAQEVLRTAPKFGLGFEEAEGHRLMGLMSDLSHERLVHYMEAKRLYRNNKRYVSLCGIFIKIANLYYRKEQFMEALAYTDSTFKTVPKTITMGVEGVLLLQNAYQLRGVIYQSLGRPTAKHYIRTSFEMEDAYGWQLTSEHVSSFDSRYDKLSENWEYEEQSRQIKSEKDRKYMITILFLIFFLFSAILSYIYLKLRKANQKTREQSDQLKSLDMAKSRFFANVSHELRTPLTLLLGPIGILLKENQLTDAQNNLLQMANRSGKQLHQLVTDILDLGKLEMGKMELHEKPTELAAFFRRCTAQFESLAESRQIDFLVDIAIKNDITANLDQAKCRQIINNLLSNAFKFAPIGGRVEVNLTLNNNTLQLQITDSGPGIHPHDLPHVFDRYFQTIRPDKPAEGGTGIGLALCYEYTQLLGGKIEVESIYGEGAAFQVTFPVTLILADTAEEISDDDDLALSADSLDKTLVLPNIDTEKPTILVVEDNLDLQAYIRLILSEKYHIITAENGQVALDILSLSTSGSAKVGLILSDLMMPVIDGYQLLEKVKSNDATRHIPFIMLTARAEIQDKLKALRIGVDDYLLKPFEEEELLVRIENLLKNQAARRIAAAEYPEPVATAPLLSQPDREWLETFEGYVRQHIADDTLSVSALSYHFAMSDSTLLRQMKRLTGCSPLQYLPEVRLAEARHLIENRRYNSIAQVASKVGYSDIRTFSRTFKQRFGKSPSEILGD